MEVIKKTWPGGLPDELPYVVPEYNDSEAWAKEKLQTGT